MKINLKATNLSLTPAISDYLDHKLAACGKFIRDDDESALARVELAKETEHHKHGEIFRAEIKIHLAGADLYAEAIEADLYAAIDRMKDEIIREIKSVQKKKNSLLRRGGRLLKKMLRL